MRVAGGKKNCGRKRPTLAEAPLSLILKWCQISDSSMVAENIIINEITIYDLVCDLRQSQLSRVVADASQTIADD